MIVQRIMAQIMDPVCEAGRTALQDTMAALLVGFLALTGCTMVLAGGCVALVPYVGVAGALALTGLVFLILAAGALLMRLASRRRPPIQIEIPTPPQPDPLAQVVFDLSFNLGRALRRRRD